MSIETMNYLESVAKIARQENMSAEDAREAFWLTDDETQVIHEWFTMGGK